jgi:prepilin-type N-terminal cleavage/methylation domain-containing protein
MPVTNLRNRQGGFTLIELSIVLVIIGLIVGGILVGQDLIKAAELRAAIAQIEKYETSVNAFRTKYNGIPGDLPNAGNFNFTTTGITTAQNGNGLLYRTTGVLTFDDESAAVFRHMAQANMVAESITATTFATNDVDAFSAYVPASKYGRGIMVIPISYGGVNHFVLASVASITDGVFAAFNEGMTPLDGFSVDSKMDDGNPSIGRVIAVTDLEAWDAGDNTATAGDCVNNNNTAAPTLSDDTYFTNSTVTAGIPGCTLRIRASF